MKRKEGFIYIESDFVCDAALSDSEKLMIGKIHGYCLGNNGSCYLTAVELGSQLLWKVCKAKRVIASLEAKGYIIRERDGHNFVISLVSSVSIKEGKGKGSKMSPKGDKNEPSQRLKNEPQRFKNEPQRFKNEPQRLKNEPSFIYRTDIEEKLEENIEQTSERARIIPEDEKLFSEFWAAYPKKVDRKGSLKAFKNIPRLKEVFPEIMQALTIQKRSKQWNEQSGRFIPHPTTYIHQERWTAVNEADKQQEVIDKITQSALVNFGFISEGDAWDE